MAGGSSISSAHSYTSAHDDEAINLKAFDFQTTN